MTTAALCVGLGCTADISPDDLARAAESVLLQAGLRLDSVRVVATSARRAATPALQLWASRLGADFAIFDDTVLAAQPVVTRSTRVQGLTGLPSVAEAAALAASDDGELLLPRQVVAAGGGQYVTVAIAQLNDAALRGLAVGRGSA